MITFDCPHCESTLRLTDANAGSHAWCRACRRIIRVPEAISSADAAPASEGEETAKTARNPLSEELPRLDDIKQEIERAVEHGPQEPREVVEKISPEETVADASTELEGLEDELSEARAEAARQRQEIERLTKERDDALAEVANVRKALEEAQAELGALKQAGPAGQGNAWFLDIGSDAGDDSMEAELVDEEAEATDSAMLESFLRFTRPDDGND